MSQENQPEVSLIAVSQLIYCQEQRQQFERFIRSNQVAAELTVYVGQPVDCKIYHINITSLKNYLQLRFRTPEERDRFAWRFVRWCRQQSYYVHISY